MEFFYMVLSWIGLFLVWKYLARYMIDKGRNKVISHLIGAVSGFIAMLLIIALTIDVSKQGKENHGVATKQIVAENSEAIGVENADSYLTVDTLSENSIKGISPAIIEASVNQQYAGNLYKAGLKYSIDVHIKSNMLWGGAQDWNRVAENIFTLSKQLFERKDVGKIMFVIWNEDHSIDWARVEVNKLSLPNDWNSLTYLQFFSFTSPMSGSVDSEKWLTEFYAKYSSANPNR